MRLKGNTMIITGGNGGIGEAMALTCAGEGANVVIVGRNRDKNERVCEKLKGIPGGEPMSIQANLKDEGEIKSMVSAVAQKYGRIDTLVNNAGIFGNTADVPNFMKPFDEITVEEWDTVMATNVRAAFLCCKHAAPVMRAQNKGSIINVASTTAWLGAPMFLHYGASKGALLTMTKGLAISLAPYNVRVNTLCPGQVMTDSCLSVSSSREEVAKSILGKQLLRIVTEPEDIAGIIVYLASDESRVVTGQAFGVNGGGFLH